MNNVTKDRAEIIGEYILDTGATVRAAAKVFKISKSTVHKDVSERLKHQNPLLYKEVRKVLDLNKSERHIRGGMATRRKYKGDSLVSIKGKQKIIENEIDIEFS